MITIAEAWNGLARGLGWALWGLSRPPVYVGRHLHRLATSFRFWILVLLGLVGLLVAYYAAADRYTPLTTDAYVQAYVIQVAPQVGEKVVRVHVKEGDKVRAGELLFELEGRPFEHKVASWEAKLAAAEQQVKQSEAKLVEAEHQIKQLEAELAAARADQERLAADADYAASVHRQEQAIFKTDSTTERRYLEAVQKNKASQAAVRQAASAVRRIEEALNARISGEHALVARVRAQLAGERAVVTQTKAQLAEARLNLSYTRVLAPCAGLVTDLQLREGAYAHTGQAVMTLIDTRNWLVVANFRENSLARLREGMPARVALRGLPGRLFNARVVSVGGGVSQGQGVPSGQLPNVKVPTSWVPPAQRFQVRLTLDDPESVPLRVGMTGSVAVYTEPEGFLNGVTEFLHQVIARLYYL
jgi:multidrug efflux system membrane fusion protein